MFSWCLRSLVNQRTRSHSTWWSTVEIHFGLVKILSSLKKISWFTERFRSSVKWEQSLVCRRRKYPITNGEKWKSSKISEFGGDWKSLGNQWSRYHSIGNQWSRFICKFGEVWGIDDMDQFDFELDNPDSSWIWSKTSNFWSSTKYYK